MSQPVKRRALGALSAALAMTLMFTDVRAEDVAAAVPPQLLADALDVFAKMTGYQLIYRAELANGLRTQGAHAGLPAIDMLRELLHGTGLSFHFINEHTIAIVKAPEPKDGDVSAMPSAPATPPTTINARPAQINFSESASATPNGRGRCNNVSDKNPRGEEIVQHRKLLTRITSLFVACGATLPVSMARAQESASAGVLEEIVVTAEKRETSLQNTPVAVSVVTGGEILSQGITQLDDALKSLAGVDVPRTSTGTSPTIRGVGPTLPANAGGSAGVSSTFDGVYSNSAFTSRLGFYDLARLEVLRGPQGTLYGRNAEGGVVAMVSNDPSQKFEGSASADVGNYSLVNLSGMVNVPLASTLALRVAASSVSRNGYVSNGQDDNKSQGARAKLLFKPSDSLSLLVGGEFFKLSGEGPGTVPSFTTAPSASLAYRNTYPTDQYYRIHGYKAWAQLTADVGIGQLTVLPSYQYQSEPRALVNNGQFGLYSPGEGALLQRSAEVRLASNPGSPITWLLGYYRYASYQDSPADSYRTSVSNGAVVLIPGQAPFYTHNSEDSTGLFAQATIPITDRLRAIAGIRRSKDEKSSLFEGAGEVEQGADWSSTDFKLGGEFDVTAQSMLYLTASSGYRPGGLNPGAVPGSSPKVHLPYKSEKLRSYELGSKNQFLGNTLRLNASVYYYDYKDYQLNNLVACGNPGQDICANAIFPFNNSVYNLPVTVKGAELESQYLPTANDSLTAGLSLQKSEVTGSLALIPFAGTPAVQLQGQTLPNSPSVTFTSSYRHTFHLWNGATLAPMISPRYSSSRYVTIWQSPTTYQEAYWEWDASVQFAPEQETWSVNAYIKNATQEVVKSTFLPLGSLATSVMTLQPPRTYGLAISARF